jgi:membrane-bound lytic murein transglycosylase F
MSFPYRIAFTLRGNSIPLRDTINSIIDSFIVTEKYNQLVYKYIESEQKNFHRKISLLLLNGIQISKLDQTIKIEAQKINWDWRLLSALILKESRFEAYATSKQGTYGLMQFMPRTGAKYGVLPNSTPEVQVEGGVKYLGYLQNLFSDITDLSQRPKFVLASYNAGPAHIIDARRVAAHFNENNSDWAIVSKYLLMLNDPEISNLECVKHGAYNGRAVVNYVNSILSRFSELSQTYSGE